MNLHLFSCTWWVKVKFFFSIEHLNAFSGYVSSSVLFFFYSERQQYTKEIEMFSLRLENWFRRDAPSFIIVTNQYYHILCLKVEVWSHWASNLKEYTYVDTVFAMFSFLSTKYHFQYKSTSFELHGKARDLFPLVMVVDCTNMTSSALCWVRSY